MKKINTMKILNWMLFAFLLAYSALLLYLIVWAAMTSLKDVDEYLYRSVLEFPSVFHWDNYKVSYENFIVLKIVAGEMVEFGLWDMLYFSVLYAVISAVIAAGIPMITAYICAKYDFWFCKVLYYVVVFTMACPIIGGMASTIDILNTLGLYNTFPGMWAIKAGFTNLYFLIFYGSFKSLSGSYMEAARIDGASEFRIMTQIMLPLAKTIFYTVFLILFIELWNDYQTPLLYIPSKPTLAAAVFSLSQNTAGVYSNTPIRMTCCMILFVPIFTLFIVFRKKLMGNLTVGGVK